MATAPKPPWPLTNVATAAVAEKLVLICITVVAAAVAAPGSLGSSRSASALLRHHHPRQRAGGLTTARRRRLSMHLFLSTETVPVLYLPQGTLYCCAFL